MWDQISQNYYAVVQTEEIKDKAVCALLQNPTQFPDWPLKVAVPLGFEGGINRGDVLEFNKSELIPVQRAYNNLIHNESKVNAQAEGLPNNINRVELQICLGIVKSRTRPRNTQFLRGFEHALARNLGKATLEVCGLAMPVRLAADQILDGTADDLEEGTVVQASVFKLPKGARCCHSYWLTPEFPKTENWQQESRRGYQRGFDFVDIHVAYISPLRVDKERLILPVCEESLIPPIESSIALANQVYANALVDMAKATAVTSKLTKVPPTVDEFGNKKENNRWKIVAQWDDLDKLVPFLKVWSCDRPVRVFADAKTPIFCADDAIWANSSTAMCGRKCPH